jgi:CO/xanthine dehydrogenase FAD-binding subunit
VIREVKVVRPGSLDEALRALADLGPDGMPIAGGTDVLVKLRARPRPGVTLVDLSRLRGLRYVRLDGGTLAIGALATHADVASSPDVRAGWAALATACSEVGSLQIRNRGTLAGNVANASPCADAVTALVALDAVATLASSAGTREILVGELIELPYRTGIRPGELITGLRVPAAAAGSCFVKLGRRRALAISRINAAAAVAVDGGAIASAAVAVGSVMPRTERVREAEEAIAGRPADAAAARLAGEVVARRMIEVSGVRWSTPYKEAAVKAVVARAVAGAIGIGDL